MNPASIAKRLFLLIALLGLLAASTGNAGAQTAPTVLRVKWDAAGAGNGSSWTDAYTTIQAALNAATGGTPYQIWVVAGTYKSSPAFQLKNNVAIYGGFAGSETDLTARNWTTNVTTLSGVLQDAGGGTFHANNVVTGGSVDGTAVLDGFTVTGGAGDTLWYVDHPSWGKGGGIYVDSGSPTLSNLTVSGNSSLVGGGMYLHSGNPVLTNVTFSGNSAGYNVNDPTNGSDPFTFEGVGGGMAVDGGSPSLTNVTFSGNSAAPGGSFGGRGGGMHVGSGTPSLTNVVFSSNTAGNGGGGLSVHGGSVTVTNGTFGGNSAPGSRTWGGGIFVEGGAATLVNSILWANTAVMGSQINVQIGGAASVTYSIVQGWTNDPTTNHVFGSAEYNPRFVDIGSGNLRLQTHSPAIDAGNNAALPAALTKDRDNNDRFLDDTGTPDTGSRAGGDSRAYVDMGAYEFTGTTISEPDLFLEKYHVSSPVQFIPGAVGAQYTIIVGNSGWAQTSGTVMVTDALPAGLTATAMSGDGWTCTLTPTLGCTRSDALAIGARYPAITLTVNVASNAGSSVTNTATVSGGGDTYAANNSASDDTDLTGAPPILYVKTTGTSTNSCADWDHACNLQTALQRSVPGSQIWVAAGAHIPSARVPTGSTDPRTATFTLKNGVSIYGGFAGTEATKTARNWTANVTTLSGGTVYHVVTAPSGTDSTAILDGFTITGGQGGKTATDLINSGAGMLVQGSPTVANVTFSGNQVTDYTTGAAGGGMYLQSGSPALNNVTFSGNDGVKGGGMYVADGSPTLTNVAFSGNGLTAGTSSAGGGMYVASGTVTMTNVTFSGHEGTFPGGAGMYVAGGTLTMTGGKFSDNTLDHWMSGYTGGGAGMAIYGGSVTLTDVIFSNNTGSGGEAISLNSGSATLTNVIFTGNTGRYAGGMYIYSGNATMTNVTFSNNVGSEAGAAIAVVAGSATLTNSILWGNTGGPQVYVTAPSSVTISYSDVQGGCTASSALTCGAGNTGSDPLFVNASDPDGADNVYGNLDDGLRLQAGSPAIDAGSNDAVPSSATTDLAGNPRKVDGGGNGSVVVDMGAYEMPTIATGAVIYVDADNTAAPVKDGTSWATAFTDLQQALAVANPGPGQTKEIWVAAGTYKPTALPSRDSTFSLKNGVAVYGGFAGTETAQRQRNWSTNVTTLSGEIGAAGSSDNSYHVVTIPSTVTSSGVLDGFTISGGNANGSAENSNGGGTYISGGSPTLTNLTLTANNSSANGGGVFISGGSPTVSNVTFGGNSAAIYGGGMYVSSSSLAVTNVAFSGNTAHSAGGGMYVQSGNPTLTGVSFSGNTAESAGTYMGGGGMYVESGSPTLTGVTFENNHTTGSGIGGGMGVGGAGTASPTLVNVAFSSNTVEYAGGGLGLGESGVSNPGSATLTNVIFRNNSATECGLGASGGGLSVDDFSATLTNVTFSGNSACALGGGIAHIYGSGPTLTNSILWGNTAPDGPQIYGTASISYSDVQMTNPGDAPYSGTGNINANPLFVSASDLRLQSGSPAIDAGNNAAVPAGITTDLADNPRFVDSPTTDTGSRAAGDLRPYVDMGAYEYQQAETVSPAVTIASASGSPTSSNPVNFTVTFSEPVTGFATGDVTLVGTAVPTSAVVSGGPTVYTVAVSGMTASGDVTATIAEHVAQDVSGNWNTTSPSSATVTWTLPAVSSGTIYVNAANTAPGTKDGMSWATAYTELRTALASASPSSGSVQIWVAGGVYRPTGGTDRTISFAMKNGVAIYGGFAGTETLLSQRDLSIAANASVLSGDIGTVGNSVDNSYHVVTSAVGVSSSAVLDGFTITGGNANSSPAQTNGGGAALSGSPSLSNLIFTGNYADNGGGAEVSGSPSFTNVVFTGNSALGGGGLHFSGGGNPTLINVSFGGNSAGLASEVFNGYPFSAYFITMRNSVLWGSASLKPSDIVTYSAVQGGASGEGNINLSASPFADAALHLSASSPAIDAGKNANVPGGVTRDLESSPRTVNGIVDMGAYEFHGTLVNNAPTAPSVPSPANAATGLDLTTNLSWTASVDSDLGDSVTYQVKFGTVNPPTVVLSNCDGISGTTCDPNPSGDVAAGTYYWQVVAKDNHGVANSGPVWSFATLVPPIRVTETGSTNALTCGGTWDAACALQTAIGKAISGQEIWVAGGTYKPAASDQNASFAMKDGVAIYGGFTGTETLLSQRNWSTNVTTLTGDLIGNDSPNFANRSDNSYTVVKADGITRTARLDGFTISGGNNMGMYGGGLTVLSGSPTLANLIFSNNYADNYGGGLYVSSGSPSLTNASFSNNKGLVSGGGMFLISASPTLTNVTLSGNATGTFNTGAGIAVVSGGSPTLTNAIVWGNSPSGSQISGSADVTYSIVQGATNSAANHVFGTAEYDPDFVSSTDLSLQSTSPAINAGNSAAPGLSGVTTDLAGNPRIYPTAGTVDMGAYEYQGAPSVSDLTISKTHTGNFTQGQVGATYTITVTNSGTAATSGTVTVTDTLPTGLTATGMSGTDWTCTLTPILGCTTSSSVAAAGNFNAISLTVNVATNTAASVTNTATVSGGGETNTSNDSASDITSIVAGNPVPAITGVSPASLVVDTANRSMALTGTGFVTGAVVRWYEPKATPSAYSVDITPSLVTSTQIQFSVPSDRIGTAKTVELTVVNPIPGGGSSNIQPILVTPAGVSVSSTITSTSGSAQISGVVTATGAGGTGTLYVAQYSGNPAGSPSTFAASGQYVDVFLATGSSYSSVAIQVCDSNFTSATKLFWWSGSAWAQVLPPEATTFNSTTKCLTFTATSTTTPSIAQITGMVIVGGTPETTPPVVSATVIQGSGAPGYLHQGDTYYVYANAADTASGVSSVAADLSAITTVATSVSLTSSGGPWTVGGTSYSYRSAQQTAVSSLSEGVKNYTVNATDVAGNTSGYSNNGSVAVDNTAPSSAITFPGTSTYSAAIWAAACSTAGMCGTASDTGGSGVAKVQVSVKRGSDNTYWNGSAFGGTTETWNDASTSDGWANWGFGIAASNFTEGSYTVRSKALDAAGNEQGTQASESFTFTTDTVAPSSAVTFPASGTAYNAAGWTAGCSTSGTDDVCGSASDNSGGSGVAKVEVSIKDSSNHYWNGSAFGTTETWKLASGTTSWTYSFVRPADGSYTIQSRATDNAGNVEASSTTDNTHAFTFDTTAPTAPASVYDGSTVGVDTDYTSSTGNLSANWTTSTSLDVAGYRYAIGTTSGGTDVVDYTEATGTSVTKTGLSLTSGATYYVSVRAYDGAGNLSSATTSDGVTVDTTPPTVSSIVRAGVNPTDADSVGFTVTFSEAVSGVDSSDFSLTTTGVSGARITGVSSTGTTYTVTVDTGTGDGTVGLNLVDDDSIVDRGGNLLGGTGTIGAADGSFTGQVYTIDKSDPMVTIESATGSGASDTTSPFSVVTNLGASIVWYGSENGSYGLRVGGPCGSSDNATAYDKTTSGVAGVVTSTIPASALTPDGVYTVLVCFTDSIGHTSSASVDVIKDTTAPATTIALNPVGANGTNGWYVSNVTVAVSASDGIGGSGVSETRCVLDPGTAPATFDDLLAGCDYTGAGARVTGEGTHTIYGAGKDSVGNKEAIRSQGFKIDKTPPTATITSGPDSLTSSTSATFVFGGSDPRTAASGLDHLECQLDSGGWAACTSPKAYVGPLPTGDRKFEVRAVDVAGNVGPTPPASYRWRINAGPTVSNDRSTTTTNVQYSDAIPTVTITATDADTAGSALSASASYKFSGGTTATTGLPTGLKLSGAKVVTRGHSSTVTWTVSGKMLVPAGSYEITIGVSDGMITKPTSFTIVVGKEDAKVRFAGGNPVAVKVASAGGNSGTFSLSASVSEAIPDKPAGSGLPGDISKADLTMVLVPVGPEASPTSTRCTLGVSGSGYDSRRTITCTFTNVPVNTYAVQVRVTGNYYQAPVGEDVVGVYDPSLGCATGAGDFNWPVTGDLTHFSFTMKYNKGGANVHGSFMLTQEDADGDVIKKVKSNSISSLSVSKTSDTTGWATFSGKATYVGPDVPDDSGNYTFTVYVEDNNQPNIGTDKFWTEVKNRTGNPMDGLHMDWPAATYSVAVDQSVSIDGNTVKGSNIFVPHTAGSVATPTPTPVPTKTPTPVPTTSVTPTPLPTGSPIATATPQPTGSPTPTWTRGPTVTSTPTSTPKPTASPTATPQPTVGPTIVPTTTPKPSPTRAPTSTPRPKKK
jgi:uncharacterized repeat protein (TIGR01451 family)